MTNPDQSEKFSELRKRAEQLAEEQLQGIVYFSPEDTQKIIQDLRVHQIELELQNEELRLTQTQLEIARHKYADLYDFSPVGLLVLDNHECIKEANLTFVTLMGIEREKLIERNLSDFIDGPSQDIYHVFFQSLRRGQPAQPCEITLLPSNQIPLPVRLDGVVLAQAGAEPTCRIAVSDIRERRQAELERAHLYTAEREARTQAERLALRLASLQRLTAALSEAASPQQVADVIIRQGLDLFGTPLVSLALLTENEQTLEFQQLSTLPDDVVHAVQSILVTDPLPLSDAVRTQQIVWLPNLQEYHLHYPHLVPNVQLKTGIQAVACLSLNVKGRKFGGMSISFTQAQTFSEDEKNFIMAMVEQCALAMDRAQQARQMAAVQERQWLARELHDSVTQSLFAASLIAQQLPSLWERKPEKAREQTKDIVTLTQSALAEMRTLLIELRPEAIAQAKLHDLLKQLGIAVQGRKPIQIVLDIEEREMPLPAEVQIAIYRIAQESINNVVKHSQASQLRISLTYQPEQINLMIEDDGKGFDVEHQTAGFGQSIVRERAKAIGAHLTIDSEPGKGTRIKLIWKSRS